MAPDFDNPTLPGPLDGPTNGTIDSHGQPCLATVVGTELALPTGVVAGGASFIKKRIASYLHLELKPADIRALLGLNERAYEAILTDPEVLVERQKIAVEELHRAAFLRLQLAQAAEPALRKLVALRDNAKDERVQLAAAESLLDRDGTLNRKITPTQTAALLVVTDDQVKAGLRAALESLSPTVPAYSSAPGAITSGGSPSLGEEKV